MGCSCSTLCSSSLPATEKPMGRLSVTTRDGVPIPLQFFNLRYRHTVIMSGVAVQSLARDLPVFAQVFTRELECNLMAFWTETPRKGSISDFESVLWFASACTRHSAKEIVIYASEEEAAECLRLCGRVPEVAGLVLSLSRCSADGLRAVVNAMDSVGPVTCPILLLHSHPDPAPLLANSLFYCGSDLRTAREITKKDAFTAEVVTALFAFLRAVRAE